MKIITPLFLLCLLAGCDATPPEAADNVAPHGQNDRFQVTTAQRFYDGDNRRFILVLYDTKTKKEYLAITGAGVTDMHCTYDANSQVTTCEEK